jgi:hypothetical protein
MQAEKLIEKLKQLPPERVAEVEDFIDFLAQRDERRLTQTAMLTAEDSLRRESGNKENGVYDATKLHEEISAYAAANAGSDLDAELDV